MMDCKVKNLSYDRNHWLYKHSEDNTSRYILGEKGKNNLICVGINPSSASPEDLDNTMKIVKKIARVKADCDGYIMINVYPQRATNPDNIDLKMNEYIVKENLKYIERILKTRQNKIWAAWGNNIEKRGYLKDCLKDIVSLMQLYDCKWIQRGKQSKKNHPHHPLYVSMDENFRTFNITKYISTL